MDTINSGTKAAVINVGGYRKEALEQSPYQFYIETGYICAPDIPHYHRHEASGIEYVVQGECINYINGEKYVFDDGCACLMSAMDIHRFKQSQEKKTNMYFLYFSDSVIMEEMQSCVSYENLPSVTRVSGTVKERIEEYFRELLHIYHSPYSLKNKLIAKMRINEIVMLLLTDSALPEKAVAASKKRITEILTYVRENLSEPITVEAIAGVFHLNHDYFSRSFIKETGKSFHEYLTCLRIDLAKKILKTNECDIQIVAQTCGFSSASHFVQVFKKVTGYTPAKYRRLDI